MRDALAAGDSNALTRMASAPGIENRPVASLRLMGRLLIWDSQTERAQAFLTRAWRVYPNDFWITLDLALAKTFPPQRFDQVLPYITAAVALRPDSAMAHMRLAVCQRERGDDDAAEHEFRAALRIWPDYAFAHLNLAQILASKQRFSEAAVEYRSSIRLNLGVAQAIRLRLAETLINLGEPNDKTPEPAGPALAFEHWHSLGVIRLRRGDSTGANEALRRAAQLTRPDTLEFREISDALLQVTELERLIDILAEKVVVEDAVQEFYFTQLCENYRWFAGAARIYARALAGHAGRLPEASPSHYFRAARFAVIAGTSSTDDKPPLGPADQAQLRAQALLWMRFELADWKRKITPTAPEARLRAGDVFRLWLQDAEFARVRSREALAKLPEPERDAWQAFWREVDACLAGGS